LTGRVPAAAVLLFLSACVTPVHWQPSAGEVRSSAGFSLVLPPGWMVLATSPNETSGGMAASREGPTLQCIAAGVTSAAGDASLPLSALKAWQRLPLYAAYGGSGSKNALLVVATLGGEATAPEVLSSSTSVVGGRPGFRAEVAWTDPHGLPVRSVVVGATVGAKLYWLLYAAPARHYYELDLATFEAVERTFRIDAAAPVPP